MVSTILEKILLRFSRRKNEADFTEMSVVSREDNPLDLLIGEFPWFRDFLRGKRVLDFGCGEGRQSVAMATNIDCRVVGLDINDAILETGRSLANEARINSDDLRFTNELSDDIGEFDIVISQNSMEHFPDPEKALRVMKKNISKRGCILITFGPPWYAPYGSHMHFFCKIPWLNILFPESVVMNVRKQYRNDGAQKFEEVESGLNKMTLNKFSRLLDASGLHVVFSKFSCVKGLNFLERIPIARELFVNRVSVVVSPTHGQIIQGQFREFPGH